MTVLQCLSYVHKPYDKSKSVCVCERERASVSANREKTRANIHLFIKRAEREDVL